MLTHNNDATSYSTYIAQPLAQAQNMAGTVMHGTIKFIGNNKVNIGKIALYAGCIYGIIKSSNFYFHSTTQRHSMDTVIKVVRMASVLHFGKNICNTIYDTIFNIKREKTILTKREMLVKAIQIATLAGGYYLINADWESKQGPYYKARMLIENFLEKKILTYKHHRKIETTLIFGTAMLLDKIADVAGDLSRAAMNRIWPKVTNITQAVSDSKKIEEKVKSNLPKDPLDCGIDGVLREDEDPQPAKSPASEKAAQSTSTKIADKTDPFDKAKSDLIDLIQARKAAAEQRLESRFAIIKTVVNVIKPMIEDFSNGEDDRDCMLEIQLNKSTTNEEFPLSNRKAFNEMIVRIAGDIADGARITLSKYKDAQPFKRELQIIDYKTLSTSHSLPDNDLYLLDIAVEALDEEISKGLKDLKKLHADINQDTEAEISQVSPAASEAIPADPEEIITFVENILENLDESFIEELFSESESQALSDELDKIVFEERPLDEEAIK